MPNTSLPFSNAHSHIFTVNDAPDFFLKTAIKSQWLAELVDRLVQKGGTRTLLQGLHGVIKLFSPNYRNTVERYIEFVEIGTSATQGDIFKMESDAYMRLGACRIVVLTQVLDYLDYTQTSNHKNIQTQVEEVVELKRNALFQDKLIPFLGVDPRMQGVDLLKWVQQYINKDFGFYGIKIYPAYGFFPFDVRLDPVWKWAAENDVPVMTHCTRGGSFYLGPFESILSNGGFQPQSLNPGSDAMPGILDRIRQLAGDGGKPYRKNNKVWCNIFGHPENYIPVLEKYPNLKICLAHVGGADEINRTTGKGSSPDYPDFMGPNWYPLVTGLLNDPRFPNVYSDISYTLSDADALDTLIGYFRGAGKPAINRLMYGSDFYLTQQETKGDEPDLITTFLQGFNQEEIYALAFANPDTFLRSLIHS